VIIDQPKARIRLRLADGLRIASSKNTPTGRPDWINRVSSSPSARSAATIAS